MPNRILREGILTSPKVAKLGWPEEVFYRRLISVVDDFGRYYADPGMLRAACYPRLLNKVSDSDVGKWLASCATAALVRVYEAEDSERYLELLNFNQQMRAKNSKFPHPLSECSADATQMQSNDHLGVCVAEGVDECDLEPTALVGTKAPTSIRPNCPYVQIADCWNRICQTLPKIKKVDEWAETRRRALRSRWLDKLKLGKYNDESSGVEYWKKLFEYIEESDFLCGRNGDWRADFDWVVNPTNLSKIIEGKYENKSKQGLAQ